MSTLTTCEANIMPCAFVNHGGGPMPLLGQQPALAEALGEYSQRIPTPTAILVITAHWIEDTVTISSGDHHSLYFDYYNFPPESYKYTYDAPGSPQLASTISGLLGEAGISHKLDSKRGWDHGVFVPLMLMFPQATIPVVAMSLHRSLDPDFHIRVGQALAPLRQQGVFILGSGASFHNFEYFFARNSKTKQEGLTHSHNFDQYLEETLSNKLNLSSFERLDRLRQWSTAPSARDCHKVGEEEHLIPLHVLAGAGFGSVNDNQRVAQRIGTVAPENELAVSSFEWVQ